MGLKLFSINSSGSGGTPITLPLSIADGGTGQTTATLAFDALNPMTTKGDIIGFNGTDAVRFAQGASGTILSYDPSTATGLRAIATPTVSPLTTKGDLYGYSTVNARIGVGSDYQYLRALASATPGVEWFTPFLETDDGNSGTTKTIDFSAQKFAHKLTLTGNVTLTLTAPSQVGSPLVMAIYTGAGSFTVTWPSTVKWASSQGTLVVDTTASRMVLVNLYYAADGNYYSSFAQSYTP